MNLGHGLEASLVELQFRVGGDESVGIAGVRVGPGQVGPYGSW